MALLSRIASVFLNSDEVAASAARTAEEVKAILAVAE